MTQKFVSTHVVGPREKLPSGKPWINAPLTVKVPFPAAFNAIPIVVASALQDPKHTSTYPDTFAVTVISVTKTDFTVNICRADYVRDNYTTSGWGQNLHLSYIAETPA